MKIVWNEQSFNWFSRASEYTGYNRALADILLKHLPQGGTLCDMGCGAALIDFELAPFFSEITCVDISKEVIRFVNEQIRQRNIHNIFALCSDGGTLDGSWDSVMALFHGGTDAIDCYLKKARKVLVLATHGTKRGNIGPEKHKASKCCDIDSMCQYLENRNIHYTMQEAAIEYGQPLTGLDDARAFVRAYTTPMDDAELEAYLASNLQKTGREDYPYYLPNERRFGIFVIRRDENENI